MTMPDEVKESMLRKMDKSISRSTIATYTSRLERNNLINRYTKNFMYYFANKDQQRLCEHKEYVEAWHNYWDDIASGLNCYDAIANMREDFVESVNNGFKGYSLFYGDGVMLPTTINEYTLYSQLYSK